MQVRDKVVLITGGARGIGKETALLFAQKGAKVVICDAIDEGHELAEEIKRSGDQAVFVKVDVTKQEQVKRMVDTVVDKFGQIDVLVNNAGVLRDAQLLKLSEEDFDLVLDVNLKGVFNCTQAVAPVMCEQGKGKIINVASVVALYGNFGQTNYVASKAGVIGMTRVWARELGPKGISVNAVAPGFIATDMMGRVPDRVLDSIREKTPLGRLGEPRDVANVYLFLASDEADFINGAVICVDGGLVT
ncbi:MAG: 3-oxoacyl-(acyl-carrier-protein) reductase FabG [Chloroflexi bacterium]|nr:3-oxoacyl-(acyl-carrier-protein) reductase FabG [Chloroflexota bacterium]